MMSCFLLPAGVIHDINRLIVGFWWGDKEGARRHWKAWTDVCCRAVLRVRVDLALRAWVALIEQF